MTEGEVCLDYAKMAKTQRQSQLDRASAIKNPLFKRKRGSCLQDEGRLVTIGAEFRSRIGNVGSNRATSITQALRKFHSILEYKMRHICIVILTLILLSLTLPHATYAQYTKQFKSKGKKIVVKKTTKPYKLQKGYKFRKLSTTSGVVSTSTRRIKGSFDCYCLLSDTEKCHLKVEGPTIHCRPASGSGCKRCVMDYVIEGQMKRGGKATKQ